MKILQLRSKLYSILCSVWIIFCGWVIVVWTISIIEKFQFFDIQVLCSVLLYAWSFVYWDWILKVYVRSAQIPLISLYYSCLFALSLAALLMVLHYFLIAALLVCLFSPNMNTIRLPCSQKKSRTNLCSWD
jgi:hypothetical protein